MASSRVESSSGLTRTRQVESRSDSHSTFSSPVFKIFDSHSTRTRLALDSRVHSNSSPRTRQKRSNTPPLQCFDAAKCSKRHRGITDLQVHDNNAEITRHPMSGGAFLERRNVRTSEHWRGGAFL